MKNLTNYDVGHTEQQFEKTLIVWRQTQGICEEEAKR